MSADFAGRAFWDGGRATLARLSDARQAASSVFRSLGLGCRMNAPSIHESEHADTWAVLSPSRKISSCDEVMSKDLSRQRLSEDLEQPPKRDTHTPWVVVRKVS